MVNFVLYSRKSNLSMEELCLNVFSVSSSSNVVTVVNVVSFPVNYNLPFAISYS